MMKHAATVLIAMIASAIGGSLVPASAPPPPAPAIRAQLAITPQNARVFAGAQLRLQLSPYAAAGAPPTWSVIGPGTVDAAGVFQAPSGIVGSSQVLARSGRRTAGTSISIVAPPPALGGLAVVSCYDEGVADVRGGADFASIGTASTGARAAGAVADRSRGVVFIAAESRLQTLDVRTAAITQSRPVTGARFSEVALLAGGYVAASDNNAAAGAPGIRIFRLDARGVPMLASSAVAGETPEGLAASADGRTFYVTDVNSETVMRFAFDPATGIATRTGVAATGHRPFGVAIDERDRQLFVADNDTPTVSGPASSPGLEVFSLPSFARIARVSTGSGESLPLGVAYDPRAARLFVTNEGDSTVAAYSVAPLRALGSIAVGRTPWLPALDVRREVLYVPSAAGDAFSVIDVRTLRPLATSVPTCGYPTSIAVFD